MTREPEMVKAYRDTWELGLHSFLSYLRDRLMLSRELLSDSGSIFVQISDQNVHHVRALLDEIFHPENFISQIAFTTTTSEKTNTIAGICDYLLWYAKDATKLHFRPLYTAKEIGGAGGGKYRSVLLPDGVSTTVSELKKADRKCRRARGIFDWIRLLHSVREGGIPLSFRVSNLTLRQGIGSQARQALGG